MNTSLGSGKISVDTIENSPLLIIKLHKIQNYPTNSLFLSLLLIPYFAMIFFHAMKIVMALLYKE